MGHEEDRHAPNATVAAGEQPHASDSSRAPFPRRALLQGGGHVARVRPWPGDATTAQLVTLDLQPPPPAAVLRGWIGELARRVPRVRTGAVSELRTAPYDALGFSVAQRLVLLHLDLRAPRPELRAPAPVRPRVRTAAGRSTASDSPISTKRAFPAGWALDATAIHDAARGHSPLTGPRRPRRRPGLVGYADHRSVGPGRLPAAARRRTPRPRAWVGCHAGRRCASDGPAVGGRRTMAVNTQRGERTAPAGSTSGPASSPAATDSSCSSARRERSGMSTSLLAPVLAARASWRCRVVGSLTAGPPPHRRPPPTSIARAREPIAHRRSRLATRRSCSVPTARSRAEATIVVQAYTRVETRGAVRRRSTDGRAGNVVSGGRVEYDPAQLVADRRRPIPHHRRADRHATTGPASGSPTPACTRSRSRSCVDDEPVASLLTFIERTGDDARRPRSCSTAVAARRRRGADRCRPTAPPRSRRDAAGRDRPAHRPARVDHGADHGRRFARSCSTALADSAIDGDADRLAAARGGAAPTRTLLPDTYVALDPSHSLAARPRRGVHRPAPPR